MVGDMAGGVVAAHAGTRVHAVLVDTGEVPGTLCVHDTLGPALNVRVAGVVADAGAAGAVALLSAHRVDAARRGVTRLYYDG